MTTDSVIIKNIKSIKHLSVRFVFSDNGFLVVTGKNGIGKTSLVKAFSLLSDPLVFNKSSGDMSINEGSYIEISIEGFSPIKYTYNVNHKSLDSKDILPRRDKVVAELSVPYGDRFKQFSLISEYDRDIRANIASSQYKRADKLIEFLKNIYLSDKFDDLKETKVKKHVFYFRLLPGDYYIREDYFSSGEFFLIQLFRLITSGASLVLVDEVDVALDAAAQVRLYSTITPLLKEHKTRLIVISHSLAFMSTVGDGEIYYLEDKCECVSLEQRSLGYVKSDLYGFMGKDRYILVEDDMLAGFVRYLINRHIKTFFEYEIIAVGGEPQINSMISKNDKDRIFSEPQNVIVVVDKDIIGKIKSGGLTKVYSSPVDDIELFIYKNRGRLLPHIELKEFKAAEKEKKTAKTFWRKLISSGDIREDELYLLVESEYTDSTGLLITSLRAHLEMTAFKQHIMSTEEVYKK